MKKSKFLFCLLTIISIAAGLIFISRSSLFKIKNINCLVNKETCPEDLRSKLEKLKNKSLFFTNLELEIANTLGEESNYSLNNISKKIPDEIILNFNKQAETNSKLSPLVLTESEISSETQAKLEILLNGLEKKSVKVSSIQINKELFILEIDNKQILIKDNPELAIEKLALILEKFDFAQAQTEINEIDLRFNLPILRENKTSFQTLD